jgi:hypothetical protein
MVGSGKSSKQSTNERNDGMPSSAVRNPGKGMRYSSIGRRYSEADAPRSNPMRMKMRSMLLSMMEQHAVA